MDWRQSEILILIRSYKRYECLWNCHSPDYKQTEMRRTSWVALGKEFKKDVDEVKKKIKHLRTSYIAEKKKVHSRINKNGETTYEPHLYYFNQMTFLDDVIILKNPVTSDDPLSERKSKNSLKERLHIVSPKRQRLDSFDNSEEEPQPDTPTSEKSRSDSIDSLPKASPQFDSKSTLRRLIVNDVSKETPRKLPAKQTIKNKEDTFCAMLCSELLLLKSEETYDNVTADIFTAIKNAKITQRQIEY